MKWTERLQCDIDYINNISFKQDVIIIFNTIKKVIKKEDILVANEHIMQNLDEERKENATTIQSSRK